MAAAFSLHWHSVKEASLEKEAKKATRNRRRDDDDDDGSDDNDDSTTTSKTHECVSSSSFPTYTNSPSWLTASSASSSTLAKETLTAMVEITTTAFACTVHTITSTSPDLFLLPTSTGLASISANPAPTIVGKRPIQTAKTSIMVSISATLIILLLSLVGYLVFRIRRYRQEREKGKKFSANESRSNRQSSVCELDTNPATHQRRTWYGWLRQSFITPKAPVQIRTSHVNRVPDYDSYFTWAHRSSSVYSVATMSDISSGYGTYGSQHALPTGSLGIRVETTKSSVVY